MRSITKEEIERIKNLIAGSQMPESSNGAVMHILRQCGPADFGYVLNNHGYNLTDHLELYIAFARVLEKLERRAEAGWVHDHINNHEKREQQQLLLCHQHAKRLANMKGALFSSNSNPFDDLALAKKQTSEGLLCSALHDWRI